MGDTYITGHYHKLPPFLGQFLEKNQRFNAHEDQGGGLLLLFNVNITVLLGGSLIVGGVQEQRWTWPLLQRSYNPER